MDHEKQDNWHRLAETAPEQVSEADAEVAAQLAEDFTGAELGQMLVVTEAARVAAEQRATDAQEEKERLRFEATHDPLTRLPNKRYFQEIERRAHPPNGEHEPPEERRESKEPAYPVAAVVAIDIDNFKTINDSVSHQFGDFLLQAIASRLDEELRVQDRIFRLGGDEFVVAIGGGEIATDEEIINIAQRLENAVDDEIKKILQELEEGDEEDRLKAIKLRAAKVRLSAACVRYDGDKHQGLGDAYDDAEALSSARKEIRKRREMTLGQRVVAKVLKRMGLTVRPGR